MSNEEGGPEIIRAPIPDNLHLVDDFGQLANLFEIYKKERISFEEISQANALYQESIFCSSLEE